MGVSRGTARAGIIPAYAGSTCRSRRRRPARWDHPRIRGEHYLRRGSSSRTSGSSPHTRGARRVARRGVVEDRIIPAYAGSTSITARGIEVYGDHPRIRGEHFVAPEVDELAPGSSPHTRGALSALRSAVEDARIIPAYAGSTARRNRRPPRGADHPRIRGEHAAHGPEIRGRRGSSPHTRGARPGRCRRRCR